MQEHQERTKHFFLIGMVLLRGNAPKLAPGYIAQWLERLTADQQVPGSNPGVPLPIGKLAVKGISPKFHNQWLGQPMPATWQGSASLPTTHVMWAGPANHPEAACLRLDMP